MSKFFKFKKLLSAEEAIVLLTDLTEEQVVHETVNELILEDFLHPIIGANKVLVGFTGGETDKIMDGEKGAMSLICDIGIPCTSWLEYDYPGGFTFSSAEDEAGETFYFAIAASTAPVKKHYELADLESLNPLNPENQSFPPQDLYKIADAANSPSAEAAARSATSRRISHHEFYVREIQGMPFPYYSHSEHQVRPADLDDGSANERPSSKLLVAALVAMLVEQGGRRITQDLIAATIDEKYKGIRGLGPTTTKTYFAEAKKALKAAMANRLK
ncbi:hypothetical protein ACA097_17695 [Pseudomonas sp. QL9]|uniref:hypothetical protein n=1 Tax=Pseudomonas sp. QL9 TaxID=3242725 RepID=UPI00352A49EF